MINLATLTLKVIDPTRNLNRWYVIQIGKDLFGHWSIQVIATLPLIAASLTPGPFLTFQSS